jgi:hypothetical protein
MLCLFLDISGSVFIRVDNFVIPSEQQDCYWEGIYL